MKLRRVLLVVLLSVAFVGACGGGDDDDTAAEPAASDDADSGSNGGIGDIFDAERCAREVSRMAEAQAAALQAATGNVATLEEAAEAFEELADAAPAEIRADMQIVAEGYTEYTRILAEANFDPSGGQAPSQESLEKLQEAGERIDTEEFRAASERVSRWFEEECGR